MPGSERDPARVAVATLLPSAVLCFWEVRPSPLRTSQGPSWKTLWLPCNPYTRIFNTCLGLKQLSSLRAGSRDILQAARRRYVELFSLLCHSTTGPADLGGCCCCRQSPGPSSCACTLGKRARSPAPLNRPRAPRVCRRRRSCAKPLAYPSSQWWSRLRLCQHAPCFGTCT